VRIHEGTVSEGKIIEKTGSIKIGKKIEIIGNIKNKTD